MLKLLGPSSSGQVHFSFDDVEQSNSAASRPAESSRCSKKLMCKHRIVDVDVANIRQAAELGMFDYSFIWDWFRNFDSKLSPRGSLKVSIDELHLITTLFRSSWCLHTEII